MRPGFSSRGVYRWLPAKVSTERASRGRSAAILADILPGGIESWKTESQTTRYSGTPQVIVAS